MGIDIRIAFSAGILIGANLAMVVLPLLCAAKRGDGQAYMAWKNYMEEKGENNE